MFCTSFTEHNEEVTTEVCDLMRTDQILTIREVAKELGISFGSCLAILTKYFGIRHVSYVNPMTAGSTAGALSMFSLRIARMCSSKQKLL